MPKFVGLVPGRIVRFMDPDGRVSPAVVVETGEAGICNLGVFGRAYTYRPSVPYSEVGSLNTWHWPPRNEG